mgnify:CR=1 FL=1
MINKERVKQINILILGSAPDAILAREWSSHTFTSIVSINNSWKIRDDWAYNIFPTDFPLDRRPKPNASQKLFSAKDYVPAQNKYGGFVYAGGTMAFTAAYWTLATLKPKNLFFLGCDMVYSGRKTHFYGTGTADPLRSDVTLRSLEAKSARLECFASAQNCAIYNLSQQKESRLVFRRKAVKDISKSLINDPRQFKKKLFELAIKQETALNYFIDDGKYWKHLDQFDTNKIDNLDNLWLECLNIKT